MRELSIDIETFSSIDLKKTGLYKYALSPDFKIMLFAYAFDDEAVQLIDLTAGEQIPAEVIRALYDANVLKTAHNAAFEWWCLSRAFSGLQIDQWRCTMAHAFYCSYPGSLAAAGAALGLPEGKQKMKEGKALITYFCKPCKPTKVNGGRTRNLPEHDTSKWEIFKNYCRQDVVTEREIKKRLSAYPMPEREQKLWELDVKMNADGVAVDIDLIGGAIAVHRAVAGELKDEAMGITGLENPNSVAQLKEWLEHATGEEIDSLAKAGLQDISDLSDSENVKRVIKIRQELGKTSVKKFVAMKTAVCEDRRVRGLLQYYGATRTGRYAGRLVQMQNLPRNYMKTLDMARKYVKEKDTDMLKMMYGNVPDTLSQLIRTAFVPSKGHVFAVADFSAIEARVLAWLAGEDWKLDVFRSHGKLYEATASRMFNVPIEKISKGNPEYEFRQRGKVAELSCGYQGSVGALISQGALNFGLVEDELQSIVDAWRNNNPNIKKFWSILYRNFVTALGNPGEAQTLSNGVSLKYDSKVLGIDIFGLRYLYYNLPKFEVTNLGNKAFDYGNKKIVYYGIEQGKWKKIVTYGGKLTENLTQAVARDCLAEALLKVSKISRCVMHVHDEIIAEVPEAHAEEYLEEMIRLMCEPLPWAPGLPLNADGYICEWYRKE